jgi:hypothetical protein
MGKAAVSKPWVERKSPGGGLLRWRDSVGARNTRV